MKLQVTLAKPSPGSVIKQEVVAHGSSPDQLMVSLAEWLRQNTFEASTQTLLVQSWANGQWIGQGAPRHSAAEVQAVIKDLVEVEPFDMSEG